MTPKKNYNQMYKEENDTRNKEEMKESKLYEEEEKPVEEKKPARKPRKKEGVVVGGTLNIRNNPNGDIVGSLPSGEVIEILEEKDGWYKIDKGFVMAKFVEVK